MTEDQRVAATTNEPAVVAERPASPEIKQLEARQAVQLRRLTGVLRWEPLLGVAVLLCASLLSVFAGTLQAGATQTQSQPATNAFNTVVKTSDNQFTLAVRVTPFHFGNNTFTVRVLDSKGVPATNVGVTLYVSMLDMDMGTDTVSLQSDGTGQFSGQDTFSMAGHWQLRIQVRTPENTTHIAKVVLTVPF